MSRGSKGQRRDLSEELPVLATSQGHVTLICGDGSGTAGVGAGYGELAVLQLGVDVGLEAGSAETVQAATNDMYVGLWHILQADGA